MYDSSLLLQFSRISIVSAISLGLFGDRLQHQTLRSFAILFVIRYQNELTFNPDFDILIRDLAIIGTRMPTH